MDQALVLPPSGRRTAAARGVNRRKTYRENWPSSTLMIVPVTNAGAIVVIAPPRRQSV
jgi:hypothetical protein